MSQVKISGNASGTGVFTVASPNSNNTQTLTLPDTTGTLMAQTATGTNLTSGTKYQVGGVTTNALAWVNFNGTTSPGTIRSQYNVSSVTKVGTGQYTLNFTNALADTNYAVVTSCRLSGSITTAVPAYDATNSTSAVGLITYTTGAVDCTYVTVAVFGN